MRPARVAASHGEAPRADNAPRLVVGASGFIGHLIWSKLPVSQRQGTFCTDPQPGLVHLDLRDADETWALVHRLSPAVIFQPAGLADVDSCEIDPSECRATTVAGTLTLARAARAVGATLVYFSSDYVFDGQRGPYEEDDLPCPINEYGKAKLAAERHILETLDNHLIIRSAGLYGWERRGKNFVMGLLARLRQQNATNVPVDQIGSPTLADNMIAVVFELIALGQRGTFHVSGSQIIDRYSFAGLVAEAFGLNQELIRPVRTPDLGQKAARPLQAGLRSEKAEWLVSTRLMKPEEGLRAMRQHGNPFPGASSRAGGDTPESRRHTR